MYFEQVRGLFDKLAKPKDARALPIRVIAFQSDAEYQTYRSGDSTDAFYVSGQDRDYIVIKSVSSQFDPVAIHQFVHLLIKRSGLDLPVWLEEGLAEMYSPLKAAGSQVEWGGILSGRAYELKNNKWMDFSALASVDRSSPLLNEKQKAGIFYSESWALTHMLSFSGEYQKKFPELLAAIKAGDSQSEVFEKIYGKTLPQLQEELPNYMRGARFNSTRLNMRLEKATEWPEIKTVTQPESEVALADLQAATQRRAESQPAEGQRAQAERVEPVRQPVQPVPIVPPPAPKKRETETSVATAVAKRPAEPVQAIPPPAPKKRETEASVSTAVKRPAEPAPAAPQPAPKKQETEKNVATSVVKRPAEPVPAIPQPAPKKPDVETTVATSRAKRPVEPAPAVPQPAPQKHEVEANVAASRAKHPVELAQAVPQPAPQKHEPEVRVAPPPQPAPPKFDLERAEATTRSAEGTLQQIDCAGSAARLRILVAGQQLMLLIEDVNRVSMKTANKQVTHEFICGPQEPVTVAIQYTVKPDPMFKTEGSVRTLEFR